MIEFALMITILVALIATRKLWNQWLKLQAEQVTIWVKDSEVDLQQSMHEVKKKQEASITKNGSWLTLKDLDQPKS